MTEVSIMAGVVYLIDDNRNAIPIGTLDYRPTGAMFMPTGHVMLTPEEMSAVAMAVVESAKPRDSL